jgi:hypothetical protein
MVVASGDSRCWLSITYITRSSLILFNKSRRDQAMRSSIARPAGIFAEEHIG